MINLERIIYNIMAPIFTILFLLLLAAARKSFLVKEQLNNGSIKVTRPRVMAYDRQWCVFKDS